MPRNSAVNNYHKQTFRSYIDFDSNGDNEINDDVWTDLDSSGASHELTSLQTAAKNPVSSLRRSSTRTRSSISSIGSVTKISEVLDGVNYFHLYSNRSQGICGRLTLTSVKLSFESYSDADELTVQDEFQSFVPFLTPPSTSSAPFSSPSGVDIYLLNVGDLHEIPSADGNFTILSIYCVDFRCVEFQLKSDEKSNKLIAKLKYLSANGILNGRLSKLTHSLKDRYAFVFKADWDWFEGHWWQCYKLRVTQCNESFQLCDSLPSSFVVPKTLGDDRLLNSISTQVKGQRVPVVTYLYAKNGHMLLRCASFEYYDNLKQVLYDCVSPLREVDVDSLLPPMNVLDSAYQRLRDACYQNNSSSAFSSKISKWMWCVNRILKTVFKIHRILTQEASVGLIEDDDRHWNGVLSALTQLLVDHKRRTIAGFESLISKELIYLNGLAYRIHSPRNPHHVLFTIFLDCVFQLMIQNPAAFEFSSFYLVWLFDCQYMQFQLPITCSALLARSFAPEPQLAPPITSQLTLQQLMLLHNPFYKSTTEMLQLKSHVCKIQFWSTLYLRWHKKPNPTCQLPHEMLYLKELQSRFR